MKTITIKTTGANLHFDFFKDAFGNDCVGLTIKYIGNDWDCRLARTLLDNYSTGVRFFSKSGGNTLYRIVALYKNDEHVDLDRAVDFYKDWKLFS